MKSKNYSNYLLEDFLVDEDFRNWVEGNDERLEYFWQKWMESHPVKVKEVLTARQILLSLKFNDVKVAEDEKGDTLQNIIKGKKSPYDHLVPGDSIGGIKNDNSKSTWMAIAAAIALILLSAGVFIMMEYSGPQHQDTQGIAYQQKATDKGQKLTHTLPDGSRVILNAESKISFPRQFDEEARIVELSGEAYFEVVEDASRPFTVVTGNTSTKVLGTTFNVNAYRENNETTVSLLTGKVKVMSNRINGGKEVILNPGERVIVNQESGVLMKSKYDFVKDLGWKDNILAFERSDYQSVIKKLERWYGVNIHTVNEPPEKWEIRGYFKDASLEEVLKSLQYTNKIEFNIENKDVELKF